MGAAVDEHSWPLRRPLLRGSYTRGDVTLLFEDVTDRVVPRPTEEVARLARRSGGRGHRTVVPVEDPPSAGSLALFEELLVRHARDTALLSSTLAARLVADLPGQVATVVSIARAGTPIGVIVHRLLQARYKLRSAHYSISLVPHLGIDVAAMRYVLARHPASSIRFVDGWTGKGGITRVLAEALRQNRFLREAGVDDRLAVLTDPGRATSLAATRADILIPSARR